MTLLQGSNRRDRVSVQVTGIWDGIELICITLFTPFSQNYFIKLGFAL
jgi:hypothetical protein